MSRKGTINKVPMTKRRRLRAFEVGELYKVDYNLQLNVPTDDDGVYNVLHIPRGDVLMFVGMECDGGLDVCGQWSTVHLNFLHRDVKCAYVKVSIFGCVGAKVSAVGALTPYLTKLRM